MTRVTAPIGLRILGSFFGCSLLITTVFPIIYSFGRSNKFASNQVRLLQANNLASNSTSACDYLQNAVDAWLRGTSSEGNATSLFDTTRSSEAYVLWAQLLPARCDWQRGDGVITWCSSCVAAMCEPCEFWNSTMVSPPNATPDYFADVLGVRVGGIVELDMDANVSWSDENYSVRVIFDETATLTFS
jgi:hypothetical protein